MTPEELHNIFRTEAEFWWYRGMRATTRAFLDPVMRNRGGGAALDVGCGTGYNALQLQKDYKLRVTGVDLALLGVQYCRKQGLERSAVASAIELPFASDSFDLVTSIDMLPVLPPGGDDKALREFARVLRPGGWLLIRVAAFQVLRSRHSQFIAERHRYRAGEMLEKLAASGFQVQRWSYVNTFLSPVALLKFRVWEPLLRCPPQSGVAEIPSPWLNRLLAGVLEFEGALLRRRCRFLFGQSWMAVARKVSGAPNSD